MDMTYVQLKFGSSVAALFSCFYDFELESCRVACMFTSELYIIVDVVHFDPHTTAYSVLGNRA